jgi:hypothetical protein
VAVFAPFDGFVDPPPGGRTFPDSERWRPPFTTWSRRWLASS